MELLQLHSVGSHRSFRRGRTRPLDTSKYLHKSQEPPTPTILLPGSDGVCLPHQKSPLSLKSGFPPSSLTCQNFLLISCFWRLLILTSLPRLSELLPQDFQNLEGVNDPVYFLPLLGDLVLFRFLEVASNSSVKLLLGSTLMSLISIFLYYSLFTYL